MAGTSAGGKAAAATILAKNPNFYAEIGKRGGEKGHTGGFYDRELARRAGALGGSISRRRKTNAVDSSDKKKAKA